MLSLRRLLEEEGEIFRRSYKRDSGSCSREYVGDDLSEGHKLRFTETHRNHLLREPPQELPKNILRSKSPRRASAGLCPSDGDHPELETSFSGLFLGTHLEGKDCDPAGLLQESLGPFGPEVSPECPRECPRKWGVCEGVSDGVSAGPFAPRAPECPKSVPRVSPGCQKGVLDTPGTHSGHSRDTFWTLRSGHLSEPKMCHK